MKKILIAALAAGLLLTGCANAQAEVGASRPASTSGSAPASQPSADVSSNGRADAASVPPQAPETKTVYGEIAELIGNAVTVKEIEMPRFNLRSGGRSFEVPSDENGAPDFSQMELPEGVTLDENGRPDFSQMELPEGVTPDENGAPDFSQMELPEGVTLDENGRPDFSQAEFPEGGSGRQRFGQGQMPEGSASGGEMPEGFTPGGDAALPSRQGGGAEVREPDYTGEEIEIIIPVGLPVTLSETNKEGVTEAKEIQLDDIKIGDMITVTYKENGTTIDSVSVSQDSAAGGVGGFTGMPADGGNFIFSDGGPGGGEASAFSFGG